MYSAQQIRRALKRGFSKVWKNARAARKAAVLPASLSSAHPLLQSRKYGEALRLCANTGNVDNLPADDLRRMGELRDMLLEEYSSLKHGGVVVPDYVEAFFGSLEGWEKCAKPTGRLHSWVNKEGTEQLRSRFAEWRQMDRLLASGVKLQTEPLQSITAFDLYHFIDGRTVALVANSAALLGQGKGAEIDAHDIVVRFNSFAIHPDDTGEKTSIHAAIHLHDFNLSIPVVGRLIFSGKRALWAKSIKERLDPRAQEWIGDPSLHWPVKSKSLVDDQAVNIPTTGFNVLRLLDLFGNAAHVHLYGFDSYASGMLRLKAAEHLPIASAHAYDYEKEWIERHSQALDGVTKRLTTNGRSKTPN